MFNILLIAKDKVGVDAISWGSSSSQMQLLCQIGNLWVGKLLAMFCFITSNVLATE